MLRTFNTKPSNDILDTKINKRCVYKKHGKKCSNRAFGAVNSNRLCKLHYNEALRNERKNNPDLIS